MEEYGLEKIKTIGDAYLCAGGLPEANDTHAVDATLAAFKINDFMKKRLSEKTSKGDISFQVRIGINSGPVVAGIVGSKKFAYDIWGDAVKIAGEMEQACEPGRINISATTYSLVKALVETGNTYTGAVPELVIFLAGAGSYVAAVYVCAYLVSPRRIIGISNIIQRVSAGLHIG
jgi:class 3 adenylate cyclase